MVMAQESIKLEDSNLSKSIPMAEGVDMGSR